MVRLLRVPLLLILAAVLSGAPSLDAQQGVIYVVRHAERASSDADSPLSPAGYERARELARMLADVPLTAVLSTDTRRTRETAEPVAADHGLQVELYESGDSVSLSRRLRSTQGHVLLVGHSNTVPDLVRTLGGQALGPIADDEYDRLYVVTPSREGGSATSLLRFGARGAGR